MKVLVGSIALALTMGLIGAAGAGEGGKCTATKASESASKSSCTSGEVAKAGCTKGDSAKACATKCSAPCMKYQVGEEVVCSAEKASELASGDKSKITYLVAGKEYKNEAEAYEAYATVLNRHLEKITTVSYKVGDEAVGCPVGAKDMAAKSGQPMKYVVGPASYESKDEAEKVAKAARAAADKVALKTMCEGKEIHCASDAKAGAKVEYVVGDKKSCCKTMASVELARARIEAAMNAIAPATAGI